jgi:RNA polymerase sigma-70 factor (ECF subfamily)
MLFSAARLPARLDSDGNLLRLQDQDRGLWDQSMIARGMYHFTKSTSGDEISEYQLQAGIAACHSMAADYAGTNWRQILALYDRLIEFDPSPIVALNRAVAIAEVDGPQAGVEAIRAIPDLPSLDSYYLLHAVLGEFELRLNHLLAAAVHFRRSLELVEIKSEQVFLAKRLQACEENVNQESLVS